jgi:hypothetical protein
METVAMPFAMSVVRTAVHLGACLAEEVNPVPLRAIILSYVSACIGSLTGNAERSFLPLAVSV